MWCSFEATLYRDAVGYAAFYAMFHVATRHVASIAGTTVDMLNPLLVMCCGASSGIAYWTACYPIDSIKTLVQARTLFMRLWGVTQSSER